MSDKKNAFKQDGYLVLPGLLSIENVIDPVKQAYENLIDEMFKLVVGEHSEIAPILMTNYATSPLPARLAMLLGLAGHDVFDHLSPATNIPDGKFRYRPEFPIAQFPELFNLLSLPALLDAISQIIGDEINIGAKIYPSIRLTLNEFDLLNSIAEKIKEYSRESHRLFDRHLGTANWYAETWLALPNASESLIVHVWIPLTKIERDNGCLKILPGSHRFPYRALPTQEELRTEKMVTANPGDVVLLHNKLFKSHLRNTSINGYSFTLNLQYFVTGQYSGNPYLPSVVLRNKANPSFEMHDPLLWQQIWRAALTEVSATKAQFLGINKAVNVTSAMEISKYWDELNYRPEKWLHRNKIKKKNFLKFGTLLRKFYGS